MNETQSAVWRIWVDTENRIVSFHEAEGSAVFRPFPCGDGRGPPEGPSRSADGGSFSGLCAQPRKKQTERPEISAGQRRGPWLASAGGGLPAFSGFSGPRRALPAAATQEFPRFPVPGGGRPP